MLLGTVLVVGGKRKKERWGWGEKRRRRKRKIDVDLLVSGTEGHVIRLFI